MRKERTQRGIRPIAAAQTPIQPGPEPRDAGRWTHLGRALSRRTIAVIFAALPLSFLAFGGITPSPAAAAGQAFTNTMNYGSPAGPRAVVPADMDVQIHVRDAVDQMSDPIAAGHGTDCSAPPATHTIQLLSDAVYACKYHLMTAIADAGYGEIALTPDVMANWSSGTTSLSFQVSTQQDNGSDWAEVWLTPFADNQTLPFEPDAIDMQGPPKNALVFSLNMGGLVGSHAGDVTPISNYVVGDPLPKQACTYSSDPTCIQPADIGPSLLPLSSVTRTTYEIDISAGHIRFGLPGVMWWTDTDFNVPFTQAIVQLVHHSYNPLKHNPGTGIDTWHWSAVSISNAVPFTIINGAERKVNALTSNTMHFGAPAPSGSYLRFSAVGTIQVSWDGGTTFQPAVLESPIKHIEHFSSYMTPIPAGVTSVVVRGQDNAYGESWWVRDPAIWSQTPSGSGSSTVPAPAPSPAVSPPAPTPGQPAVTASASPVPPVPGVVSSSPAPPSNHRQGQPSASPSPSHGRPQPRISPPPGRFTSPRTDASHESAPGSGAFIEWMLTGGLVLVLVAVGWAWRFH